MVDQNKNQRLTKLLTMIVKDTVNQRRVLYWKEIDLIVDLLYKDRWEMQI